VSRDAPLSRERPCTSASTGSSTPDATSRFVLRRTICDEAPGSIRDHLVKELFVWRVVETAGFEAAWVQSEGGVLRGDGTAVGQLPEQYRLDYALETDADLITARLDVTASLSSASRRLELRRDGGGWMVNGERRPDLAGALDCDLAGSPLTNTMPIVRHRLHERPGSQKLVMAFVEVPSLRVVSARQRYDHLARMEDQARVRFSSGSFSQDLVVDKDGFVIDYPTMARRVWPDAAAEGLRVRSTGTPRPGAADAAP
jgi:hypothetical protein